MLDQVQALEKKIWQLTEEKQALELEVEYLLKLVQKYKAICAIKEGLE